MRNNDHEYLRSKNISSILFYIVSILSIIGVLLSYYYIMKIFTLDTHLTKILFYMVVSALIFSIPTTYTFGVVMDAELRLLQIKTKKSNSQLNNRKSYIVYYKDFFFNFLLIEFSLLLVNIVVRNIVVKSLLSINKEIGVLVAMFIPFIIIVRLLFNYISFFSVPIYLDAVLSPNRDAPWVLFNKNKMMLFIKSSTHLKSIKYTFLITTLQTILILSYYFILKDISMNNKLVSNMGLFILFVGMIIVEGLKKLYNKKILTILYEREFLNE